MAEKIKTDVAIIGAGISGLATAHFLASKNLGIYIVERNAKPGGTVCSRNIDGFLVEYGPNSLLDTTPLLRQLFEELQIDHHMEYANQKAKKRFIVRKGQLNPLPLNPLMFLKTNLFSSRAKLRLLKEPFISPSNPDSIEESLAEFVRRRLGQEFLDYAINPFVAGVYAGTPEKLSVRSSFPKLYELEQTYGSLIAGTIKGARKRHQKMETSKQSAKLFSFRAGMQTMIDALAKKFTSSISTNSKIRTIRKQFAGFEIDLKSNDGLHRIECRSLVIAIPSYGFDELDFEFEFPIRKALGQIYYPPVSMVFFGYLENPADMPLDGFGFLVPEKENRNILGTIWNSSIFPDRAPEGGVALTTFVGGTRQPARARQSEEQLVEMVQADLLEIMGIRKPPEVIVTHQWDKAIPQYNLGHEHIIDSIAKFEEQCPGLYITGNFRGGISVGDCVKQAHTMSERIASEIIKRTEPLQMAK